MENRRIMESFNFRLSPFIGTESPDQTVCVTEYKIKYITIKMIVFQARGGLSRKTLSRNPVELTDGFYVPSVCSSCRSQLTSNVARNQSGARIASEFVI